MARLHALIQHNPQRLDCLHIALTPACNHSLPDTGCLPNSHALPSPAVDFFIMQRGDRGVAGLVDGLFPYEHNSAKDIIYLGPGQEVWVLARFGPHRGETAGSRKRSSSEQRAADSTVLGFKGLIQPRWPYSDLVQHLCMVGKNDRSDALF